MFRSTDVRREAGGDVRVPAASSLAAQAGDLVPARVAAGQVSLEPNAFDVVDGVRPGKAVDVVVVHISSPSVSRSRMSASRIRVLAVPKGRSRMRATSRWVYPPK
jgi:hypothetical protein